MEKLHNENTRNEGLDEDQLSKLSLDEQSEQEYESSEDFVLTNEKRDKRGKHNKKKVIAGIALALSVGIAGTAIGDAIFNSNKAKQ